MFYNERVNRNRTNIRIQGGVVVLNMETELIEYSKEQFYNDVKEWINKQVKFLFSENWGEDSCWSIVLDSYNCHVNENHLSIWKPCFSLELYDEDYRVFIDKDFDLNIFRFPVYYIFIKDKNNNVNLNGNSITIEIL